MTGILIVNKPEGWTSQDVVSKLRGVFHERRVGHGGTLDPMATGVLPVFLGRATRAVPYFEHAEKEYIAGIRFGTVTDTQDTTGRVLEEHAVDLTEKALLEALKAMEGPQLQIPPMYSAIKVNGQKLYELARAGKEVERTPREIVLKELELLSFSGREARFRVLCSKGTYVRTICHDLGQALGCGGCMSSLCRSAAGAYRLDDAYSMEDILAGSASLLPVDSMFSQYHSITVSALQAERCYHGNPICHDAKPGFYRLYGPDGAFLALVRAECGMLITEKSFFEV